MPNGIIVYDTVTGHTEKMAFAIQRGMEKAGLEVNVKKVDDAGMDDLVAADAIVLGCPTYFATMTAKMKDFIDRSVNVYPRGLKDKVGAAFTSYAGIGAETTLLTLVMAMFLHRMIIVGHQNGEFGAIALGAPDKKEEARCEAFGERIGKIVRALAKK